VKAATCLAALAASVLLPRAVRDPGGGFAAATEAAVTFLGLAAVATVASLALMIHTLRWRRNLSRPAQIAGVLPAVMALIGSWLIWQSLTRT
jgi:hypothetical protein